MLDALPDRGLENTQQDVVQPHFAPTPSGSRPRWYVVATHSQAERRAYENLTRQGYTAYLPLMAVSRRDRVTPTILHRVDVPLFRGYCFVHFNAYTDPWRPILSTLGVYSLLRRPDGMPDPCPDAAVSALQASEAIRRSPATTAQWAPGTPCSLAAGPMHGLPAVVLNTSPDEVRIGVMFLGQIRQISVAPDCLVSRGEN